MVWYGLVWSGLVRYGMITGLEFVDDNFAWREGGSNGNLNSRSGARGGWRRVCCFVVLMGGFHESPERDLAERVWCSVSTRCLEVDPHHMTGWVWNKSTSSHFFCFSFRVAKKKKKKSSLNHRRVQGRRSRRKQTPNVQLVHIHVLISSFVCT